MADYPIIDGPLPTTGEAADWGADPDSGARVMRLTSAAGWSHNIYCEQPYCSPDGRRLLIGRGYDPFGGRQLLVGDLVTRSLTLVEPDLPSEMVAHSSWSEWAYYLLRDGSLRRVSLLSLQRQQVCPPGAFPSDRLVHLQSITPDDRWLLCDEGRDDPGFHSFALNPRTGERRTLRDSDDNLNSHMQADLAGGRWLFQLIRGGRRGGRVPVFVQGLDGGESVQLPIGDPWSAESSGHMAWVGKTGKVAVAVNWLREEKRHDHRHPEGNLLIAAPGDEKPAVFPAPQYGFYHVSVSREGRYFVCDDFMDFRMDAFVSGLPGPIRIVVGNLQTGKSRALLRDCQNYGIGGSSRYEPDPYFTADNRYVIYNASPFGLMQVFAAEVPPGFLQSLD